MNRKKTLLLIIQLYNEIEYNEMQLNLKLLASCITHAIVKLFPMDVKQQLFTLNIVLHTHSGPKSLQMTGENDPVLHLSKLVKGRYIFKLTVTDDKGLTDSDTVAVNIKESKLFIFKTMSAFLNALIFFLASKRTSFIEDVLETVCFWFLFQLMFPQIYLVRSPHPMFCKNNCHYVRVFLSLAILTTRYFNLVPQPDCFNSTALI